LGAGAWLASLAATVGLIAAHGFEDVFAAVAAASWGLLAVAAAHGIPLLADTFAWQRVLVAPSRPGLARLIWIRWVSEAVNDLVPAAMVGGEVLRAWLVVRAGSLPGRTGGASVVVDLTMAVLTQGLFTLIGLGLLLSLDADSQLLEASIVLGAFLCGAAVAFVLVQRAGLFGLAGRLADRIGESVGWPPASAGGEALDAAIAEIYRQPQAVLGAFVWRMAAWLAGTLEVWIGLWLLGHPVGLAEAMMLESLIQAVRSAAFIVPGALGVQEGALVLLGSLVGLTPELALALSLVKRFRELVWGLPGLVALHLSELHRLWRQRLPANASPEAG
jgi:putative membrane protein